jgi:hypothetical protein
MKPSELQALPSWQWPEDARSFLLPYLEDASAARSERLIASELAGDLVVMDDEIARALLDIVSGDKDLIEIRRAAAISLGPALEERDLEDLDPEDLDDGLGPAVSSSVFDEIRKRLHRVFLDGSVPKEVRRAALEASVRASEKWHEGAVRQAFESGDRDWRLTGLFCAQYIRGFDPEILESLDSEDEGLVLEAVRAAGARGVERAWRHVAAILSGDVDRSLLLAAIEAAPLIDAEKTAMLLPDLADSPEWAKDEDVQDAIEEALMMCEGFEGLDALDDEEEEDDDEPPY